MNAVITNGDESFARQSTWRRAPGFEVAGRLKLKAPGKCPTWAHPVVFGGRLYVRYGDRVGVYDVRRYRA